MIITDVTLSSVKSHDETEQNTVCDNLGCELARTCEVVARVAIASVGLWSAAITCRGRGSVTDRGRKHPTRSGKGLAEHEQARTHAKVRNTVGPLHITHTHSSETHSATSNVLPHCLSERPIVSLVDSSLWNDAIRPLQHPLCLI